MLTLMDWFCGAGGSSQGAHAVPGVDVSLAANHWDLALGSHAANFPHVTHKKGDIRTLDVHRWPVADLFWASPECTKWSLARGKKRTFHNSRQIALVDLRTEKQKAADAAEEHSRALMEQVPQYLSGVVERGRLVKAGVVENVIDEREWDGWTDWVAAIRRLGYRTRLIAFNSMHAQGTRTPAAPQSRDRLYLAYWHTSLGRDPDWDKWIRPAAWCPRCDETIAAVQVFKDPRRDMGRYRRSYLYRCPRISCRNSPVEPPALPASAVIDWTVPATPIGDRPKTADKPEGLAPATIARIKAGMAKYWLPLLTPTGGTWRTDATPMDAPLPARTTRENDGIAIAPMLVPVEGRDGKRATPATQTLRTQTGRNETGLALPPFMIPLRGGGDALRARPITAPLHTVSAEGNHHGLITPIMTPPDSDAVAPPAIDIADVLFRMLEPREIGRAMAFTDNYIVLGNERDQVRQYGNAVTPPVAELLISALVETITGEPLERAA